MDFDGETKSVQSRDPRHPRLPLLLEERALRRLSADYESAAFAARIDGLKRSGGFRPLVLRFRTERLHPVLAR